MGRCGAGVGNVCFDTHRHTAIETMQNLIPITLGEIMELCDDDPYQFDTTEMLDDRGYKVITTYAEYMRNPETLCNSLVYVTPDTLTCLRCPEEHQAETPDTHIVRIETTFLDEDEAVVKDNKLTIAATKYLTLVPMIPYMLATGVSISYDDDLTGIAVPAETLGLEDMVILRADIPNHIGPIRLIMMNVSDKTVVIPTDTPLVNIIFLATYEVKFEQDHL